MRGASAVQSKARKSQGSARPPGKRAAHGARSSAAAGGTSAQDGSALEMFAPVNGGHQAGAGPAPRLASRRALKNWRVRSRLLLLVIIPTVTALAAGGVFIASSVQSALVYQRVLTLANLSGKITGLVQALQTERQDTIQFIVLGNQAGGRFAPTSSQMLPPPGPELAVLSQDDALTTSWADQVKSLAGEVSTSYSPLAQQDMQAAVTAIGNLLALRGAATNTQLPALKVINEYATSINALLAVENQIAVGSSDSSLAGSVRVLSLVSSMKEEASQEQALLTSALGPDLVTLGQAGFGQDLQSAITDAQAQQQGDLNEFLTAATADQRGVFNSVLSSSTVVQAQAQEQQAISLASSDIATDPTISDASASLGFVVSGMRSVEQQFADSVISRSNSLHESAIALAVVYSLGVALLLGIALTATIVVGRSMVRPLRRLRNGALEVAEVRLPDMVRRIKESDGERVSFEVAPINVDSFDEIGEVARAFDQVHKEAVRLAANEAALRGNVNAMFVNLSRRSQSLVERQIRVITKLEQSEQDSERLGNLFQIDHLATRMRRNSENLLVLAGHELPRKWGRPVALVDVLRAAVSEIDQYERITLNVQAGISVHRDAVRDVVHLTAELTENATSFSAADTPVTIAAHTLSSGGALIEITDQGVGMKAEEMANANWRLDNPPVVDVAVSRRMGLFVVARLAARHGIRIRLRPASIAGVSALVWLPPAAIGADKGWDGSQDGGTGRDAITPLPRPAPVREALSVVDSGQYPVAESRALTAESWTPSGPMTVPVVRNHVRAVDPGVDRGSADRREGASLGTVVMPSVDSLTDRDRLPIFEAVESAWFRRGLYAMDSRPSEPKSENWSSPATDKGWQAAEVAHKPAADGTTRSGLPKRAPGSNLVPGTAGPSADSGGPPPAVSSRTASQNRDRLAGFQRGIQQGRAVSTGEDSNRRSDGDTTRTSS